MGLEYFHLLAPRDVFREPPPLLVQSVHETLTSLGLVDALPVVFDCDSRTHGGEPERRGTLTGPPYPQEADYIWRPSEECEDAIGDLFDRNMYDALFFEVKLLTGPRVKALSLLGVQDSVHFAEAVADEHRDEARTSWVGVVMPPEARPTTTPRPLTSPLTMAPMDPPPDWFAGVFRSCLILDFHKTLPGFMANTASPRVPDRLREALEGAFGTPLDQAWGVI